MHVLFRGSLQQRLRLVSGLVLFAFAFTHFLNHALGLVGIDVMTAAQAWRLTVTRSLPGGIVLGAAFLIHIALGLYKLASRATFKMPAWEFLQITLGLAIPFFLLPHIINTRFANMLFGINDVYIYELIQLWPGKAIDQSLLLLIVWAHACIGLHFWLRLTRPYQRAFPLLFAFVMLVPFAALSGFMVAGREAREAITDPAFFATVKEFTNWPNADTVRTILTWTPRIQYGFYLFVAAILLIIPGRWLARRVLPQLPIAYVPRPTVRSRPGPTLLEISRMHGIPHLSVCGGRARCSTCRVTVIEGAELLQPPGQAEAQTLRSIRAESNVRLACQIRPVAPVTIKLALRAGQEGLYMRTPEAQGVERVLAVLFLDVRGFTSMSEHKLPYDVVFVLNRLFAAAGGAITAQGGWIDKYLGDGLMAVFGRMVGPEEGCRQALRAARGIDLALDTVNREILSEVGDPLRIGMGLHVGPLVLGSIGHQETASLTVIGRTVNAASRLEAMTKELGCQLVVSVDAAKMAGMPLTDYQTQPVAVRGLAQPLDVIAVPSARDLPIEALPEAAPKRRTA